MYFDVSPPTPCAVSIPIQPGSARFIFFLFSSPLSHGRFPIRARLHVKISARSVYFRRKTRVARGACLRACARGTGRGEKVQAISRATHGQPLCFSLSLSLSLLGGCSRSKRVKGRCCTTPPPPPLPWNALTQSKRPLTHVHRARVKHVAPRELPATIKSAVAYHLLWRQPFSPSPFLPSLSHGNRETERKAEAEAESEAETETETDRGRGRDRDRDRDRQRQRQRQRQRERERGKGIEGFRFLDWRISIDNYS